MVVTNYPSRTPLGAFYRSPLGVRTRAGQHGPSVLYYAGATAEAVRRVHSIGWSAGRVTTWEAFLADTFEFSSVGSGSATRSWSWTPSEYGGDDWLSIHVSMGAIVVDLQSALPVIEGGIGLTVTGLSFLVTNWNDPYHSLPESLTVRAACVDSLPGDSAGVLSTLNSELLSGSDYEEVEVDVSDSWSNPSLEFPDLVREQYLLLAFVQSITLDWRVANPFPTSVPWTNGGSTALLGFQVSPSTDEIAIQAS